MEKDVNLSYYERAKGVVIYSIFVFGPSALGMRIVTSDN